VAPPTPAAIPELVLDEAGQKKKKGKRKQAQLQRGREALVTPGLAIAGSTTATPSGRLGIKRAGQRRK
jgi:hypothetical protein